MSSAYFLPLASAAVRYASAPSGSDRPADSDMPREFAAGVRIDWQGLTVEVDAEVVLREGPLELLACSPNTREHESILRVPARPLHIYQAMGLIGLEPGGPLTYDEKADRWKPPHGQLLDLRVRFEHEGKAQVVSVLHWLMAVEKEAAPESIPWVFAGSSTVESGRFAADLDGTVVCLVDFPSALIAVGALHTADNEQLWLRANPKTIPPRGTRCTLLIRSHFREFRVHVPRDDEMRHAGKALSLAALAELLMPTAQDQRRAFLNLTRAPDTTDAYLDRVRDYLQRHRFQGVIEVRESREPPETDLPPAPSGH